MRKRPLGSSDWQLLLIILDEHGGSQTITEDATVRHKKRLRRLLRHDLAKMCGDRVVLTEAGVKEAEDHRTT